MERTGREGTLAFAIAFLILSVALLVQIDSQTIWSKGKALTAQPRFWPAVGLAMMVGFGALHVWQARWAGLKGSGTETWMWIRGLEFVGWFLGYVFFVQLLGYLPASILVAVALTLRSGFRGRRWVLLSVALAIGIVVLFRVMLRVHVPGGQLYYLLPDSLSNFMLTWF